MDEQKTLLNALTAGQMIRAKIPATFPDDETLIATIEQRFGATRWMFVPNTLNLDTLYASTDLRDELEAHPRCEIEGDPLPLTFHAGRHQLAFPCLT